MLIKESTNKPTLKQKAAMILWFLGEDEAAEVVALLPENEKNILVQEMMMTKNHHLKDVDDILLEFVEELKGSKIRYMDFDHEHIKRLFKDMQPEKLEALIKEIKVVDEDDSFDFLRSITDVSSLLTILNEESPQTIAMVVSYMNATTASELLENLPQEKMVETIIAIAKLEQFDSEIIQNVSRLLRVKLDTMAYSSINKTDGVKNAANILNNASRSTERSVFEQLDKTANDLAGLIRQQMFVFEDVLILDNLDLQKVLAEIPDNLLIVKAIKGEKEEIKEKIFACISGTRKELLNEEMETLGPVKVSEIEQAQQDITHLIKKLEREGKITIQRGGEEDVLI